jgi:hypothetical protein
VPRFIIKYKVLDGKIESLFICPDFMDESLCYVRQVMSLDATRRYIQLHYPLKEKNEGYDGWKSFLTNLKRACIMLEMDHPHTI